MNNKIAEVCKIEDKKKIWGHISPDRKSRQKVRNTFYLLVCKTKKEYWPNFLKSKDDKRIDSGKSWPKDNNRYWIAAKYLKPKSNSTILILIRSNNKKAIIIKVKEALISLYAFLSLFIIDGIEY